MALDRRPLPDEGFFRGGTLASVWFPNVKAGGALDVILLEEALPLGRRGALTLLYPPLDCPEFSALR